jgi:hypothetical protein
VKPDRGIARCRRAYASLLRLYPRSYRERFGESMQQTFTDLCHEHRRRANGLFVPVMALFFETAFAILRENWTFLVMRNPHILRIAVVVGLLLLIPFVAMQFSDEVNWTFLDFVFAGALLFGTGLAYDLIARRAGSLAYRIAAGLALLTMLLLVWINAAVGIIGSENNPANLLYGAVLGVGAIGTLLARLRARGMAITLFCMALTQLLVPLVALIAWRPSFAEPPGMAGVFALNGMFALLLVASALMFRRAAHARA